RVRARHGRGRREAYGRSRAHTVTWLDGRPTVEGVEADDHEASRSLLSLVKGPDGRVVRRPEELPEGYAGFLLVDHASEIRAPYSRRGLAAKVREDDLEAWVRLAVLRARTLGRWPPEGRGSGGRRAAGRIRAGGRRGLTAPASRRTPAGRPMPSLAALEDLRDRLSVEDLRRFLLGYGAVTNYDRRLEELWGKVRREVDLERGDHRDALIDWLRHWGCRHLRIRDHAETSAALLAWWRERGGSLPGRDRDLLDLRPEELEALARAFDALAGRVAASRERMGRPAAVRVGPTAAAKALFALRPRTCPPWDEPIRAGLGFGADGAAYRRLLEAGAEALRGFAAQVGIPPAELPRRLGREGSTLAKLLDEYLWARVTRGIG
ncbi:MAG TPA: hypothetical protein VNO79_11290, partial [Actinomycetota bacterium]|nr:hypothetical protein [Actinomycetota bacterium]